MFLKRIKELRVDNDFKQFQIALYLGISQNTYSQYESGRRSIPIELLIDLCKFYNVSSDYILGLSNKIK